MARSKKAGLSPRLLIAPKPTIYGGTKYRSRLEAHWAIYFHAMAIQFRYEPESFTIEVGGKNQRYTPDFLLPEHNIYLEMKPSLSDDFKKEIIRGQAFAEIVPEGFHFFFVNGKPEITAHNEREQYYNAGFRDSFPTARPLLIADCPGCHRFCIRGLTGIACPHCRCEEFVLGYNARKALSFASSYYFPGDSWRPSDE